MEYEKVLDYIHSLEKFGIKPGMERITSLCRALGDPQKKLRFIHVAGTNGKGSTSTMMSNICTESGYKTGLFISPYVLDFRERIQIDGEMIPKKRLCETAKKLIPVAEEMKNTSESPTEFEFITALAFLYFFEEKCDVVVLETGLGGRLDSTNIIDTPLASVITSVSFDHMGVLGDTIEEISAEKCGIIKENGITVCYPLQQIETFRVVRNTAERLNNLLLIPDTDRIQIEEKTIRGTVSKTDGLRVRIPLIGDHMVYNAATAITAVKAVRDKGFLNISDEAIVGGIEKTVMPGRMQIVGEKPLILVDGGHNVGCAEALCRTVDEFLGDRKIIGICGLMADKEYEKYVSLVSERFEKLITVTVNNPRAISAAELAKTAEKYCINTDSSLSLEDAVNKAMEYADEDSVILVCGSFYMISDICKILENF